MLDVVPVLFKKETHIFHKQLILGQTMLSKALVVD